MVVTKKYINLRIEYLSRNHPYHHSKNNLRRNPLS